MGSVLVWPVLSSIARALLAQGLVVGKLRQNTLIRLLVHTSRFDGHSAARSPFEAKAQFLDTTRRAVPSMAHGGLISSAGAFAAAEKRDAVIDIRSIENSRRAVALAAKKDEVSPAIMGFPPIASNDLSQRLQRFAFGPARKFQQQALGIRSASHLKSNASEQQAAAAEFQLSLAGQFMNVKPSALHVAELAL
jgi:hypothetical protein